MNRETYLYLLRNNLAGRFLPWYYHLDNTMESKQLSLEDFEEMWYLFRVAGLDIVEFHIFLIDYYNSKFHPVAVHDCTGNLLGYY